MPKEKPIDVLDSNAQSDQQAPQTDEERQLAMRVQTLLRSSYDAKISLDLHEKWKMFDDYKHGRQVQQVNPDDPASCTNIIHPVIESQIADLVDKPLAIGAKGREVSDELYTEQVQHMMQFIMDCNDFEEKLDISEHDRLELGTTFIKVYFDEDALDGRGLPVFEPIDPANIFPDPKITRPEHIQKGEFFIHATPQALSWFRKKFPERGKYVKAEYTFPYNPEIYEGSDAVLTSSITNHRAMCLECYIRDDNDELYCVTVANYVVLEDTRKSKVKVQRRNKYPFVAIPCYRQRGQIWGQGDVELLIPTQDIINELDDQIRINARLMGNPQIVFGAGVGKGFDARKWTSKPGLRVPMRDHTAWSIVQPVPVSHDVPARREKAFEEADTISGRYNVNRGDAPGSGITAASAIEALQQAGQKTVIHKARMFKAGWTKVLHLLYDEMISNWDAEMWIRVEGQQPDYQFYDPRKLTNVPVKIPNTAPLPGEDSVKNLTDNKGKPITRDAQFDFTLTIGDGLPNDKAFIYQTLLELSKGGVQGLPLISWKEMRDYMREELGLPLESDDAIQQAQQGQQHGPMPGESINYKDLPPAGQIQMAAQAGIQLSPQQMMPPQMPPQAAPQGLPPNVVTMPQQGGGMVANPG